MLCGLVRVMRLVGVMRFSWGYTLSAAKEGPASLRSRRI